MLIYKMLKIIKNQYKLFFYDELQWFLPLTIQSCYSKDSKLFKGFIQLHNKIVFTYFFNKVIQMSSIQ